MGLCQKLELRNKKKADYAAGHAHQAVGHTMGGRGFVWPTFYISDATLDIFSFYVLSMLVFCIFYACFLFFDVFYGR